MKNANRKFGTIKPFFTLCKKQSSFMGLGLWHSRVRYLEVFGPATYGFETLLLWLVTELATNR